MRMNDWFPMDEVQSQVQIEYILRLLGEEPKAVIDIGCGDGRVLVPLASAGHQLTGIDIDEHAIEACSAQCRTQSLEPTLLIGDVMDVLPLPEPVDAIVCSGQTFMLFSDVSDAVHLLKLCKQSLVHGGIIIMDDIPGDLWPEVAQGGWANGVNEEGTMQFVWAEDDAVFTIREGVQVDESDWDLRDDEVTMRLWTAGALKLAAELADLSAPTVPVAGAVLVMRA